MHLSALVFSFVFSLTSYALSDGKAYAPTQWRVLSPKTVGELVRAVPNGFPDLDGLGTDYEKYTTYQDIPVDVDHYRNNIVGRFLERGDEAANQLDLHLRANTKPLAAKHLQNFKDLMAGKEPVEV